MRRRDPDLKKPLSEADNPGRTDDWRHRILLHCDARLDANAQLETIQPVDPQHGPNPVPESTPNSRSAI